MKLLLATTAIFTLLLSACSSGLSGADKEAASEFPELKGAIEAWSTMQDAAERKDCETFMNHMRLATKTTEADCPAAFDFMNKGYTIDWSRSEWNASSGKVKIYVEDSGSLTAFILNGATDVWGADSKFWE
ncbi:hypothetical protein HOD30_00550 [Candidatus Peregrinibacteria bacterium]|jgi:hypothetical protein|nr:hypothetical protein [Candidatus Peregrinibacteria bacterium]MBT4631968.1 hypothetical protein [Candidatus Peregrinibacteria bacterium]MBT5517056.1 hypothetical protein [Candidatus Peregrinibacteria bacterium]MBT5823643.1 hypothetical protein [Candidatus Peregrinibacteria bacterium]